MRRVSPFSFSSMEGTAERGTRSDTVDWVRWSAGLEPTCGGLDERMPVLDVGAGVGYVTQALAVACRFVGRGRPGDDDRGSNGGNSEGAGRFTPAVEGRDGSRFGFRDDGESITAGWVS
jgi:hypothetical protein